MNSLVTFILPVYNAESTIYQYSVNSYVID